MILGNGLGNDFWEWFWGMVWGMVWGMILGNGLGNDFWEWFGEWFGEWFWGMVWGIVSGRSNHGLNLFAKYSNFDYFKNTVNRNTGWSFRRPLKKNYIRCEGSDY